MLMNEQIGVISQHVILVVNDIHSATANMECCFVMITDPAAHPIDPSGKGSHYETFSTLTPPSAFLNGNGIRQRIAHPGNSVISNDDTFLPNVGLISMSISLDRSKLARSPADNPQ